MNHFNPLEATNPNILTVTDLNRLVRSYLEHDVGEVWVEGELSNVTQPASKHLYFTLKDNNAQIRCVFFRHRHPRDGLNLQNGQHFLIRGTLSLYEARGDYQLIVETVRETGIGDLFRQFELLKNKLQAMGLFDPQRKKSLPLFPKTIGVITSPHAAAFHDIKTTLARRYPLAKVILYASDVQGKPASTQLIQAIIRANLEKHCDVLILARGGGSIEDLWAFNDENLALTISQSHIPLVTGIGHETDTTLADFVADVRAPTPTAAAETVTPDATKLIHDLKIIEHRLTNLMMNQLQHKKMLLQQYLHRITSPEARITSFWQQLDYVQRDLHQSWINYLYHRTHQLEQLTKRLTMHHPMHLLQQNQNRLQTQTERLQHQMTLSLQHHQQRFKILITQLNTVSPLATLERGYAIAMHQNHVLMHATQVKKGDTINIQLAHGTLHCEVCS